MSIRTITFGCRLNAYESAIIQSEAEKSGLSDAIIVNTCAVTAEAVKQAKQTIRKSRRENPGAKIIVTGCAAQTQTRDFGDMEEVDLVLGNDDKLRAQSYTPLTFGVALNDKVQVNDIMSVTETAGHLIDGLDNHTRAFVEVQNGCDHRCTFCIIPFGRGPSRSVPMGVVVDQIKRLVGKGVNEIVLTGVDITSYGGDLPGAPALGNLVLSILRHVPDLPRLRISSIDSIEADPALYEAMSDKRLMPHLHMSLQSGDDLILKRMKRRHSRNEALAIIQKLRGLRPDMVFGADIIAGFPTESDAMFQNTFDFVTEADLTFLHVFPFSPREGTPAAKMPQVPNHIARERAAILREVGERQFRKLCHRRVGMTENVLVERGGQGRTEHYLPVAIAHGTPGDIVAVEISGFANDRLTAKAQRQAA